MHPAPGAPIDAARLTDARLLLLDLHGRLKARATGAWPHRLYTLSVEAGLPDELAQALAQSGVEGLSVDPAIHDAVALAAPWLPIPHRLSRFGRTQLAAYAAIDALLSDVLAATEALGEHWRPLEATPSRGARFSSRTRRQAYAANLAAG